MSLKINKSSECFSLHYENGIQLSTGNDTPTEEVINPKKSHSCSLTAKTLAGIAIIAIGTLACIYLSLNTSSGSPRNCDLTSDFNILNPNQSTTKNLDIPYKNLSITHFNKIPIKDIDNFLYETNLFGGRTFVEKKQNDYQEVMTLGTSNNELADHLQNILDIIIKEESRVESFETLDPLSLDKKDIHDTATFEYSPSLLEMSTIGKCSGKQLYSLEKKKFKESPACCMLPPIWNLFNESISSREIYTVIHKQDGRKLSISQKMIDHIREGYYDNTTPAEILSFLTSHPIKEILSTLKEKLEKISRSLLFFPVTTQFRLNSPRTQTFAYKFRHIPVKDI